MPGKILGLMPGDFRERPGHLLSQFLLFMVSEALGSISVDFAHK